MIEKLFFNSQGTPSTGRIPQYWGNENCGYWGNYPVLGKCRFFYPLWNIKIISICKCLGLPILKYPQKCLVSTSKFPQYWGNSPVLGKSFKICNFPSTGGKSLVRICLVDIENVMSVPSVFCAKVLDLSKFLALNINVLYFAVFLVNYGW